MRDFTLNREERNQIAMVASRNIGQKVLIASSDESTQHVSRKLLEIDVVRRRFCGTHSHVYVTAIGSRETSQQTRLHVRFQHQIQIQ